MKHQIDYQSSSWKEDVAVAVSEAISNNSSEVRLPAGTNEERAKVMAYISNVGLSAQRVEGGILCKWG